MLMGGAGKEEVGVKGGLLLTREIVEEK